MTTEALDADTTDGRKIRGRRNRDAVVDAILELINEGNGMPAVADVAARSGVSVRSVFRHFDDLESLYTAAVQRHMERLAPLYPALPEDGTVHARAEALARQRARLYEAIGPVRLVAERLQHESQVVADGLALAHASLRDQVATVFAAEIEPLPAAMRREVVDALSAAAGWALWHDLRTSQKCSVARAEGVVRRLVVGVLDDAAS